VRTARVVVTVSAAAVLGVGTGCASFADPGPARSEDRTVDGVSRVRLETSGSLAVTEGGAPRLTVTAGEAVLDTLTSEVDDGVLVLGTRPGTHRLGTVRYELVVPELDALTVTGSGDASVSGVPGDALEVVTTGSGDVDLTGVAATRLVAELSGSGSLTAAGSTGSQQVTVSGSGDYRAEQLRSEEAAVTVSGSGDARVQVTGHLQADVTGSGDVLYSGRPEVESTVAGSGDVSAV
jgi:hypothetical protein